MWEQNYLPVAHSLWLSVQALLIAFAFGAFIEGAAGFGTPVAVAAAATGLPRDDEARLFRKVLKHSLLLMALIGAIVVLYSHWGGAWTR